MARGGKRKGAGRKPTGKVAMLVRVAPEVRGRLERDAKRARRSLSSEVELQLNDALRAAAKGDPQTRALCYLIAVVAGMADSEFNWRTNRFDFEVLKGAIGGLLNGLAPAGTPDEREHWQRWGVLVTIQNAVIAGRVSPFDEGLVDFGRAIVKEARHEKSPEKIGEGLATMILGNLIGTPELFDLVWKDVWKDKERLRGSAYYALPQAARDLGLALGRGKNK